MNLDKLFSNRKRLQNKINHYIKTNQIIETEPSELIIKAHVEKSNHNIEFTSTISSKYNDWKIIGLYYSLYQMMLALIAKKGYKSKSHLATLLIIIKYYSLTLNEIKLIETVNFSKENAQFYNELKTEREKASYQSNYNSNNVNQISVKTKELILKMKSIIEL